MRAYDAYRVDPEGFWLVSQAGGVDGYSISSVAERYGWEAMRMWGRDGWPLGLPPLAIVFHRQTRDGDFDLGLYAEGDVLAYSFPSAELREQATDEIAFGFWKTHGEPWVEGISYTAEKPEWLRGPYSRERAVEHVVPGTVLVYQLHAERPSTVYQVHPDDLGVPSPWVDTLNTYYDPRDRDTARRGFIERQAEYSYVVLLQVWQGFEMEQPAGLVLATHGEQLQMWRQVVASTEHGADPLILGLS